MSTIVGSDMGDVPSPLTTLTSLAVRAFRAFQDDQGASFEQVTGGFRAGDPLLDEQLRMTMSTATFRLATEQIADAILETSGLSELRTSANELGTMVITLGGSIRMGPAGILGSLLTSARLQIFFLGLPPDEGTYVRTVLENFDELRRSMRGEKVRSYYLVGFSGVALEAGQSIDTPWGKARRAPEVEPRFIPGLWVRQTTMTLAIPELSEVRFDPSPNPAVHVADAGIYAMRERALKLFPLSIALATQSDSFGAPVPTWMTSLTPFVAGFGWSSPFATAAPRADAQIPSSQAQQVSDWSRLIEERHSPSIDVSARRIVSAISHRLDPADKLIDAVMVWENLVGTRTESTFRVTAALAKLLERDRSKRDTKRQELARLYDIRSRVVHGDLVPDEEVRKAADDAVGVAIEALRLFYRERADFLDLKSAARADRLLLEEA